MRLLASESPRTVNNLVTFVRDGFHDGAIFHRVRLAVLHHAPGLRAAAAALGFGKTIEGMDVVDQIAGVSTDRADRPTKDS